MSTSDTREDLAEAVTRLYPEMREMLADMQTGRPEIMPSKYWEALNEKNLRQLLDPGYENFKRTLARNYFTWIVNPLNQQTRLLMAEAGWLASASIWAKALRQPAFDHLKKKHSVFYVALTHLLWRYAEDNGHRQLLDKLVEPGEGNPPPVRRNGRVISQDLANSILEYASICHPAVKQRGFDSILELGSGYGRTAYVFLALHANCRYVLVDIPPALYVAQRYLTSVFPDRRIFAFRRFDEYEAIREDFESASIAFLTPNQLEALPDQSVDLFLNISSLHEMRMDQIRYYFDQIHRLTDGFFYLKQWRETTVPYENETIREADYPVKDDWQLIFRQPCEVQQQFFEALYALPGSQPIGGNTE